MHAFSSPHGYCLVLLLILATYALSAGLSASWAASLVVALQIATVWVTLRACAGQLGSSPMPYWLRPRSRRSLTSFQKQIDGGTVVSGVSCLLYLTGQLSILRHLVLRQVVDSETVRGAIATYLMAGMFFAFLCHSLGLVQQTPPFFGSQGACRFPQDLFFSFTTLTTGYSNLVPAGNPGQTFAVLEMLTGQLFLVTTVAKVVSAWRPGGRGQRLRDGSGDE